MSTEFATIHTTALSAITGGEGPTPNGSVSGNVNANANVSLDLNKRIEVLDQLGTAAVTPIGCAFGAFSPGGGGGREFGNCLTTGKLGNVPPVSGGQ